MPFLSSLILFFFNDTATTEIYTLSLHDALPISIPQKPPRCPNGRCSPRWVVAIPPLWPRDRKSTRLNSSHGYISYAVFCLKKKKKKARNEAPTDVLLVSEMLAARNVRAHAGVDC